MDKNRIIELTERSTLANGDYVMVDSSSGGTAKYNLGNNLVKDVQINGTSVKSNGAANISTNSTLMYDGTSFKVNGASDAGVKNGTGTTSFIQPGRQHQSAFYGLAKAAGDTTQSASSNPVGTYTDAAKIAIQKMLGIYRGVELIADITTTEDLDELVIDTDMNGQPFELRRVETRLETSSGSTTGAASYITLNYGLVMSTGTRSNMTYSGPTLQLNAGKTLLVYVYECFGLGMSDNFGYKATTYGSSSNGAIYMKRDDQVESIYGLRFTPYSSTSSLIPSGSHIKVYGIRA